MYFPLRLFSRYARQTTYFDVIVKFMISQAKARAEERAKGKPRYFVPDPDLEAEYVKPRAVPRWRTPERKRNSPPRRRPDDRRRR